MSKLKYTGTMRGVTPMGKTMPQNLPRSMAQSELREDWRTKHILSLDDIELRIVSVMHDEIIVEQKK